MARILVLYDSHYGQTKKIAEYMGAEIRKQNYFSEVINVSLFPEKLSLERYDGIIVGAPVYVGSFSSKLKNWITRHKNELQKMPTGFFSVCLGIMDENQKVKAEERQIVESLFESSGWKPTKWTIFAGSLAYSKYNFVVKWMMRLISKRSGGATDTDKDYEYTDWIEVRRFTQEFCQYVTPKEKEMPNWQL